MTAWYNEIDPFAAAWLRSLISAGHIAPGIVDERSIDDICPTELLGFTQCHFFAGIGGWSLALRLAGWPDDRPVWTGSCPCQPFSVAGEGAGFADERDLWPAWFNLIRERTPTILFGEQVAGATIWLDRVFADLEDQNYAVAALILPACSVDAPHRRDRLWFVADAVSPQRGADAEGRRNVANGQDAGWEETTGRHQLGGTPALADADRSDGFWWSGPLQVGRNALAGQATASGDASGTQWRIKSGVPLLAHGVSARVAKLCAIGNAIVPQVAAEFIKAACEATN